MHVTVPDIFTFFRMICAVVLPFLTPLSPAFLIIYAASGISDMLDGYLARKLGSPAPGGQGWTAPRICCCTPSPFPC